MLMENQKAIPKGWAWTTVGHISDRIHYGFTASSTSEAIGPKMLRITDIQDNKVEWDTVPYCEMDKTDKQDYLLKENDLVFARTGATVGKSFLIKGTIPETVFASYLIRIILSKNVMPDFVYNFFQSSAYWTQIQKEQLGIGQPNVNSKILSRITLPLPPRPEQRRIVSKIDELFSDLDVGVSSLKKAKAELARYRQSVLAHAFSGKLTEDWRKTHGDKVEPAAALLERIRAERGKNPQTKHKEMSPVDASDLSELPEGWKWTNLSAISTKIVDGSHNPPPKQDSGVLMLSAKNIFDNKITFEDARYTTNEEYTRELKRTPIEPGDVLLTIVATIGRSAVVETVMPQFSLQRSVALIKPIINSRYLCYFFQSEGCQRYLRDNAKGTAQKGIYLNQLENIMVPIASTQEQQQIVSEIDRRFSILDSMEKTIDSSLLEASRLRQSILKRAFEGKLVPQDPRDEPANILLERIKKEKI